MADQAESRSVTQANRSPHHHKETHGRSNDIDENTEVTSVKAPNVLERVKEEMEAIAGAVHSKKEKTEGKDDKRSPHHRHHKETHGRSDDIDETTSVDEVKGPSMFQRVKEELEAIVQAILPKKRSDVHK
ncbi:hypothetical protein V2J09_022254 [Rumex salicifolius]